VLRTCERGGFVVCLRPKRCRNVARPLTGPLAGLSKLVPHGRGARDGQLVPQLLKRVLRERARLHNQSRPASHSPKSPQGGNRSH
jgi:hypothetical protein